MGLDQAEGSPGWRANPASSPQSRSVWFLPQNPDTHLANPPADVAGLRVSHPSVWPFLRCVPKTVFAEVKIVHVIAENGRRHCPGISDDVRINVAESLRSSAGFLRRVTT